MSLAFEILCEISSVLFVHFVVVVVFCFLFVRCCCCFFATDSVKINTVFILFYLRVYLPYRGRLSMCEVRTTSVTVSEPRSSKR